MIRLTGHESYNFKFEQKTSVMDMKENAAERYTKKLGRKVYAENLEFCFCKFGEIYEQYEDTDLIESIEVDSSGTYVLIETRME